jgi:hypothetical protein
MTARVRRGACLSGKTRYRNRNAAVAGIDKTRYRFRQFYRRAAPPLYEYRCGLCAGWHMTSLSPEDYQERRKTA